MGQLAHDLVDVFLVYPEELRHSQRIMAFRDFLLRSISNRHK
jgi:hypothetical protein